MLVSLTSMLKPAQLDPPAWQFLSQQGATRGLHVSPETPMKMVYLHTILAPGTAGELRVL